MLLVERIPIPPTIGVDAGAGLSHNAGTGIVAVHGVEALWATTLHRDDGEDIYEFAQRVIGAIDALTARSWPNDPMVGEALKLHPWTLAVEAMVDAQGKIRGRRSRISPDQVVGTTVVSTAVWTRFKGYLVRPNHHGQQHKTAQGGTGALADHYPDPLIGVRPDTWIGQIADREHEREAYDIAMASRDQALTGGRR